MVEGIELLSQSTEVVKGTNFIRRDIGGPNGSPNIFF